MFKVFQYTLGCRYFISIDFDQNKRSMKPKRNKVNYYGSFSFVLYKRKMKSQACVTMEYCEISTVDREN